MTDTLREKVEKMMKHWYTEIDADTFVDDILVLVKGEVGMSVAKALSRDAAEKGVPEGHWCVDEGYVLQKERQRIDKMALEILEEHFPKMNQDNLTKPSPNGRGAAMAYMAILRTKLSI